MARWGRRRGASLLLLAVSTALVTIPAPVSAAGPSCATPGRDGTATITGVVNTYYPGVATAAAGATTITVGPAIGAATPIAVGDLVLVIQMQDATINATNTGAYGNNVAGDPASGWTALNSSGLYEYAVATSAVPLVGGLLTVSSGLINNYTTAAPSLTQGQRDFQVIRVPQYVTATLTNGLTAAPFNGSTGGVLAFDVAGATILNNAAVSVSQMGFRAGLGRLLTGGAGASSTDYVNLSAVPFHGQKGEGIAGTPQYVYDSRTGTAVINLVEGYPNGSAARGAPGTAGGGGTDPGPANDQNTGGGGGANGGAGGQGGNSWNTNLARGGFGGTAFPAAATQVTLGAGGGAGSQNNSPGILNASSGGNGGGLVLIRTGRVTGNGSITSDGGTGVAPANDGGGGGGAGGSVLVVSRTGALGGLTVNARGGAGANAWPTDAGGAVDYHGPGGGGGGGVVLSTSAPAATNVSGGVNGTTTTALNAYGATPGAGGLSSLITANQIPGAGSGSECSSDLTIAKSHSDPFVRGSTGTYTLTATNSGGAATSGTVTVTDTLPAGLTPTAAAGTGWTCGIAAQTVTCTRADALAAGASYPAITITVSVGQAAAGSLTNTASVSGGGEVDTTNDTATDPATVVSQADIGIAKIASSGTVTVGSNVNFTVTAKNNGPSDATGVQVTDLLPAGLTYVSSAPSTGSYNSVTGVWTIGAMTSGASVTLGLTATVITTGALTNTASKTGEVETDPNVSNDSASVTITGQAPDLTIAKSHSGSFIRGSTATYDLTVSNAGAAPTSGTVTVTDTLPAGLTATAATGSGWTCTLGPTVSCNRSDALGAGATYPAISVTVSVTQSAAGSVINTATVAGGSEIDTSNDSASDPTAVTSSADIAVAKIASSGTVTVGSNVTFTITVTNNGPSDATGVQVTDQLPAGLTYVSSTPSAGSYNSVSGVWTIGALNRSASVTLTLTATVTTNGALTNTATKTAEAQTDPNPANDSSSVTITGQAPDLTIAKSHVGAFTRGSTGTYTLTVSNIGTASTSGTVTVTDTLPAGLTPTAATGTGWSCPIAAQTVTCTRGDALAIGASYPAIGITVAVSQSAPASLTNTATVAGGNEVNLANDSASDLTAIGSQADVALTKIASSGTVTVGSNVTFTVTATNNGPSDASGVQVTDQLPAGLTYVSSATATGTYSSATGIWNIGSISNGASVTLTITARVNVIGSIVNTATKTAEAETDPNPNNDSASATITGQAPDLTITKSHVDPFVRGTTGSYGLVVNNIGTAASAGQVTATDTLPVGLTPTGTVAPGWGCTIVGQTLTCTRNDPLATSASYPTITVLVSVLQSAPSSLINSAAVAGGGEINLSNDAASDPTNVSSAADVRLAKVANAATVTVGTTVTYTVTATNLGPSDASGVQVTDQLPAGLTFVSATPAIGSYVNTTGIWSIGNLASGGSTSLVVAATVTTTGAISNTARKTAENENDPNLINDVSSVSITGQPTPVLPGPPNGGMAAAGSVTTTVPPAPDPLRGSLLIEAAIAGFFGLVFVRRRSQRAAIAASLMAFATVTTLLTPAGAARPGDRAYTAAVGAVAGGQQFDKPISTEKPQVATLATALHPASAPVTPYRIRIPALSVDTLVEPVGVTARGLMDVPGNIWNTAWLRTGTLPGAPGQAVIDGHLDSVAGSAVFSQLHRLKPADRIYVSDLEGNELTFTVTRLEVAPLKAFPVLEVFGPAKGRLLNLITCAGQFDQARHTYDHRLVVFTSLLS